MNDLSARTINERGYRTLRQYLMNRYLQSKEKEEKELAKGDSDTYFVGYEQGQKHGYNEAIILLDDLWEGRIGSD